MDGQVDIWVIDEQTKNRHRQMDGGLKEPPDRQIDG